MPALAIDPKGHLPDPLYRETKFRRLRLGILGLCGLVTLVVALASINVSLDDRAERLRHAETETRSFTRALEQHAARVFDNGAQFLLDVRAVVDARGGVDTVMPSQLRAMLASKRVHDRATSGAYIVDRSGMRLGSSSRLIGVPLTIDDRAHFQRHRSSTDPSVTINPPVESIHGRWVIPMTARLEDAGGAFDGVAVLEVEVDYLVSFYRSLGLREDSVVAVVSADGTIYARYPGFEKVAGKRTSFPPEAQSAMATEGSMSLVSSVDGIERILSFRKFDSYPVGVALGFSRERILHEWREETLRRSLLAGVVIAVLWLFTWLLLRRLEAERAVTLNLAHFKRAVDRGIDLVYWITPDGRIVYANDAALRRLGFDPSAPPAKLTAAQVASTYSEERWSAIWTALRRDGEVRFESEHVTVTGEPYFVGLAATRIEIEGTEYAFVIGRDLMPSWKLGELTPRPAKSTVVETFHI